MKAEVKNIKKLSFKEEVANVVTHGVSALGVLGMYPVAVVYAYSHGRMIDVVGVSIMSVSLFMMFLMSTIYHAMDFGTKHKAVMKILDHIFIYVAIAGTYTPIALSIIGGWQGWVMFGIQWAAVICGIFYKSLSKKSLPKVSLSIYLIMGWTIVFFFPLFLKHASTALFLMILGGGLFYSVGSIFYAKKDLKLQHMIWHLFVMAGAITHYIGIVFFLY